MTYHSEYRGTASPIDGGTSFYSLEKYLYKIIRMI